SVSGNFVIGLSISHSPIARCRSEWQTPQAATLIRTSPGPGVGVGVSSICKGAAKECRIAAFKVSLLLQFGVGYASGRSRSWRCSELANDAFARQLLDHLFCVT